MRYRMMKLALLGAVCSSIDTGRNLQLPSIKFVGKGFFFYAEAVE